MKWKQISKTSNIASEHPHQPEFSKFPRGLQQTHCTHRCWIPNTFFSSFYRETDKTSPSATTALHIAWPTQHMRPLRCPTKTYQWQLQLQEWGGELAMLHMQQGSKLIWGQPTVMLGGDGCSREPGWDKQAYSRACCCVLYLLAWCTAFRPALLLQLLFLRLGGLNNHSSRHRATCQNPQGFLTECGDRIQRIFPHLGPCEQKCQEMETWQLLQKKEVSRMSSRLHVIQLGKKDKQL